LPWQSKTKTAAAVPSQQAPAAVVDTPPARGDNKIAGDEGVVETAREEDGDEERERGQDEKKRQEVSSSEGVVLWVCQTKNTARPVVFLHFRAMSV